MVVGSRLIRLAAFWPLAYPGAWNLAAALSLEPGPAAGSGVATDCCGHGPQRTELRAFSDRFASSLAAACSTFAQPPA